MSRLIKGIGSGIGLAAEAIAHNKEKKALERERSRSPNPQASSTSPYPPEKHAVDDKNRDDDDDDDDDNDSDDFHDDEEEWALDAAAGELDPPPAYDDLEDVPVDDVVASFMEKHPAARQVKSFQPLPCPVILPQRRPKNKSRGFVRAYAPVLGEYSGIDQKTFLDFLDDFHQSSQVRMLENTYAGQMMLC